MKIRELIEQVVSPVPPGAGQKLPPTQPTEGPPNTSNTPKTPQPTGYDSSAVAPATAAAPAPAPAQQMGQATGHPAVGSANPQQQQQLAQQSTSNMQDLDKIAAQIVALKQRQQQMQTQLQTPATA